eukprot:1004114-Prorocentrum_minimum.AAC.5
MFNRNQSEDCIYEGELDAAAAACIGESYNGLVDEVKVLDRPMAFSEIDGLMKTREDVLNPSGLLAYFRFNKGWASEFNGCVDIHTIALTIHAVALNIHTVALNFRFNKGLASEFNKRAAKENPTPGPRTPGFTYSIRGMKSALRPSWAASPDQTAPSHLILTPSLPHHSPPAQYKSTPSGCESMPPFGCESMPPFGCESTTPLCRYRRVLQVPDPA